jgi:hypothetical protein
MSLAPAKGAKPRSKSPGPGGRSAKPGKKHHKKKVGPSTLREQLATIAPGDVKKLCNPKVVPSLTSIFRTLTLSCSRAHSSRLSSSGTPRSKVCLDPILDHVCRKDVRGCCGQSVGSLLAAEQPAQHHWFHSSSFFANLMSTSSVAVTSRPPSHGSQC